MNNAPNNLEKTKKFAKISTIISLIFTVILALGYFFALKYDFESDIGHFERSSPLFTITVAATVAAIAIPLVLSVMLKKRASIVRIPEPTAALSFFAFFAATMVVITCFATVSDFSANPPTVLERLAAYTLPFLAIALIAIALPKLSTSKIAQLFMSLAVLSVVCYILACYFDETLPLNSPVRYITMLSQLSVMFILTSEARLTFGMAENNGNPTARRALLPFYIFANNTCAALTVGFSAGALIYDILPGGTPGLHPSPFRLAVYIAIGGIALCRAVATGGIIGEYSPSPIEADSQKTATDPTTPTAEN